MSSEITEQINKTGKDSGNINIEEYNIEGSKEESVSVIKKERIVWIVGGCLSLAPVFFVGLIRFFFLDTSFSTILSIITDTSLMYTGVTLIISAINDLEFSSKNGEIRNNSQILLIVYFLIAIVCVLLYGGIEIAYLFLGEIQAVEAFYAGAGIASKNNVQSHYSNGFLIFLNLFFVFIPAMLGWKQYHNRIERAKKNVGK